jgi:hypothetical protein
MRVSGPSIFSSESVITFPSLTGYTVPGLCSRYLGHLDLVR